MRDLFIAAILFFWVPFALFKPHMGVLLWDWISHMNPHSTGHGFASTFPFLDFVAALTFAGFAISGDEKKLPAHPIILMITLFFLWTVVTTFAGFNYDYSMGKLVRFIKVILFAILTITIMQSPARLKAFVGVMTLSLLWIGVKGGLFTVLTGGAGMVQGAGGMMGDNNQLAVAMAMTVPLALFWGQFPPRPWMKWPAYASAFLTAICVVGTTSRGGTAALVVTGIALFAKSRQKLTTLAIIIPLVAVIFSVMPDSYFAKLETAENATEDSSFRNRVVMWKFATNLADENPIEGGGFSVFFNRRALELYLPYGSKIFNAHSIYFEVLGEHGYLGLLLFLTMIFTGWFAASRCYNTYKQYEETAWIAGLCNAVRVSMIAYCAGGALLNMATFDLIYHMLAVIVLAEVVGARQVEIGVTTIEEAARLRKLAEEAEGKKQGSFKPGGYVGGRGQKKPGGSAPDLPDGGPGSGPDPVLGRDGRNFARTRGDAS